jgi:ABC-type glycerol-3-phosphate transport system substrate-binding protein
MSIQKSYDRRGTTGRSRSLFLALLFALAACSGGSSGHTSRPPADTRLEWNQGNWDEQDWQ